MSHLVVSLGLSVHQTLSIEPHRRSWWASAGEADVQKCPQKKKKMGWKGACVGLSYGEPWDVMTRIPRVHQEGERDTMSMVVA